MRHQNVMAQSISPTPDRERPKQLEAYLSTHIPQVYHEYSTLFIGQVPLCTFVYFQQGMDHICPLHASAMQAGYITLYDCVYT